MRKLVRSILSLALCVVIAASPALASDAAGQVVSTTRIDYEDGSYCTIEIVEYPSLARSSTKTGSKLVVYTKDNVDIFGVRVTGTFTYDGSTSSATGATATVLIYDSSATYVGKSSSYSGSKATATGTVSISSKEYSKTVTLTCSATGVLS